MKRYFILLFMAIVVSNSNVYAMDKEQPTSYGKTIGEWSAEWWKWVRSIPKNENPLLASGDLDCSAGQSGPVFFLAGTTGDSEVTRTCTSPIPKGKSLFFSPLNAMYYNDPADLPQFANVSEKQNALDGFISGACNLKITVDGKNILFSAVAIDRTQSPIFPIKIGDEDVFGGSAGAIDNQTLSDGFWVMLRLPKGSHTLHVQGAVCDPATHEPIFQQDYKYVLQVE